MEKKIIFNFIDLFINKWILYLNLILYKNIQNKDLDKEKRIHNLENK